MFLADFFDSGVVFFDNSANKLLQIFLERVLIYDVLNSVKG